MKIVIRERDCTPKWLRKKIFATPRGPEKIGKGAPNYSLEKG